MTQEAEKEQNEERKEKKEGMQQKRFAVSTVVPPRTAPKRPSPTRVTHPLSPFITRSRLMTTLPRNPSYIRSGLMTILLRMLAPKLACHSGMLPVTDYSSRARAVGNQQLQATAVHWLFIAMATTLWVPSRLCRIAQDKEKTAE